MTGGLYDAPTLERWNVINRVVARRRAAREGDALRPPARRGPTNAHAATKRIVRAYLEGGVDKADRDHARQVAALFATEDLQNAVQSFLEEGPGKATFEGR